MSRNKRSRVEKSVSESDSDSSNESSESDYTSSNSFNNESSHISNSLSKEKEKIKNYRSQILSEEFGYTSESNPFNDSNLSDVFLWKKKINVLKASGENIPVLTVDGAILETQRKITEIQNVKKRREARKTEDHLLEEHQALLARERDLENFQEWQSKEISFNRETAMLKMDIRIRNQRARPCDLLVKSLRLLDGESFDDMTLLPYGPDAILDNLSDQDLDIFCKDLETNKDICTTAYNLIYHENADPESSIQTVEKIFSEPTQQKLPSLKALSNHLEFWKSLDIVISTLMTNRNRKLNQINYQRDMTSGIASTVLEALENMLKEQTVNQLNTLETQVHLKLKSIRNNPNSQEDITYWETINEKLPYFKALANCRQVCDAASTLVNQLKKDQQVLLLPALTSNSISIQNQEDNTSIRNTSTIPKNKEEPPNHDISLYFPYVFPFSHFPTETCSILTMEDYTLHRQTIKNDIIASRKKDCEKKKKYLNQKHSQLSSKDLYTDENAIYEKFVFLEKQSLEEDEYIMTPAFEVNSVQESRTVTNIDNHSEWDTKYKPRKPQFFNRVKTGYEWSKYNQTHFDRDNPPPKAVQGYKFNIFYLDLIDKTKTPSWELLRSDTSDTVLIQFRSGPPYEDIIFKIINREWDLNPRSGFKNTFDRGIGILQLHFNFKRYRYRR